MPETIDEMEHAGRHWELRMDSKGRPYGVLEGRGRISVDLYKRAQKHEPLSEFDL